MSNKHAATEDEIGKLHKLITQCHHIKLDAMLTMAKEFQEEGSLAVIAEVINSRDIASIQKWVEYNAVTAIAASEDGETELAKKLRMIKEAQAGKVVQFQETGSE